MEMGTGYWLVAGYVMLAVGSVMFLLNGYRAVVSLLGRRIDHLTMVLLSLYPMGVGFKAAVIGPEFLRFHLSDIGFSVFVGFVLYSHFRSGFEKNNPNFGRDGLADTAQALRHRKVTLVIGLIVSYVYESLTGLLYSLRPDMEVKLVGKFDWWDIVDYTLGAALCYLLLVIWQLAVYRAQKHQSAINAERRKDQSKGPRPGQRPQPKRRSRKGKRK
jgi:hypothetical protein